MDNRIKTLKAELANLDQKIAECKVNGETLKQFYWNDERNGVLHAIELCKKEMNKGKRIKRTGFARAHVTSVQLNAFTTECGRAVGTWEIQLKGGDTICGSTATLGHNIEKYAAAHAHDAVLKAHPTLAKLSKKKFVYVG